MMEPLLGSIGPLFIGHGRVLLLVSMIRRMAPTYLHRLLLLLVIGFVLAEARAMEPRTSSNATEVDGSSRHLAVPARDETAVAHRKEPEEQNYPALEASYSAFVSPARRKLALFRQCSPCKCCTDSTQRYCYYTACCYRIDCFAAGLPFGHCSFTPVTCNCLRC